MSKSQIEKYYGNSWDSAKAMDADPYQEIYIRNVVRNFRDHEFPLQLPGVRSYLSIGHGEGDFDIPFIRNHLPNLEQFYGVDLRDSASQAMEHHLEKLKERKINRKLEVTSCQEYGGPETKVDLIYVGDVLCYCVPEYNELIRKMLSWLKPRGVLITCSWIGTEPPTWPEAPNFVTDLQDLIEANGIQSPVDYHKFATVHKKTVHDMKLNGYHVMESYSNEDTPSPPQGDVFFTEENINITLGIVFLITPTPKLIADILEKKKKWINPQKGNLDMFSTLTYYHKV